MSSDNLPEKLLKILLIFMVGGVAWMFFLFLLCLTIDVMSSVAF